MTEGCGLCGRQEDEHRVLEQQKLLNHRYSESGDLVQVERGPARQSKPKPPREVMVVPAVDLLLRQLLVRKGIISEADLADLGAVGTVDRGDLSDRPTPPSD